VLHIFLITNSTNLVKTRRLKVITLQNYKMLRLEGTSIYDLPDYWTAG